MIAINGMLCPLHHCLADEIRGFEVHVGHPHRQNVGIAEHLLAQIILNAISISAIDNLVEIVFHHLSFCAAKLRKISWSFAAGTEKRCTFAASIGTKFFHILGESHSGNCNRL